MTIENELNEEDLFNDAVSDETPEPQTQIEQLAEAKAEVEALPVRDEIGRYAKADEKAETELEAEKPPIPPKPEWRLKEDAERARAAETELANERAEKAALKQRLEEFERAKPEKVEKPAKPDPLLDPDAYEAYLERKFEDRILNDRREASLANAHKTYKTEFEEAYAAAQKQVDPALKVRMQQSRDPGEELISWHRENKVKAEVGSDPNAWLEKKMEERLKDPAFLAKAVELARGIAQPQNNGRPRVDLPPSLNGASRSGAALRPDGDVSDRELFEQSTS